MKSETIKERRKIKEEAKTKMIKAQEAGDFKEAKKYAQQTSKLTSEMLEESKKLIENMSAFVEEALIKEIKKNKK